MSSVLNIIEEIKNESSTNNKVKIVERHKDNELFKNVCLYALSNHKIFGIKKIPEVTEHKGTLLLENSFVYLDKFANRELTGNSANSTLMTVLSSLSKEDARVFELIIKKDLKCNMGATLINRVWKNLIPEFPCLLAKECNPKNLSKIVYPAISQKKADGTRQMFVVTRDGHVSSYSRQGKSYDFLGVFDAAFNWLAKEYFSVNDENAVVFDGEIVVYSEHGDKYLPRSIGNGIVVKGEKGTITKKEAEKLHAVLWDIIPYSEFSSGKSNQNYRYRYTHLKSLIDLCSHEKYELIESRIVFNEKEAFEHFNQMLDQGEEGTVLKNYKGIWSDTRSPDLVKLKAVREADLKVVGWNKGKEDTSMEGKVGSLICESSDGLISVSVSGFTDKMTDEITSNINEWVGSIISIKYNEKIIDSVTGKYSLFSPRFVERRFDKQEADSFDKID